MNISEKNIQKALAANGFDPGPIDGVLGAMTRAAIRAFQASNGLVVDGIVGKNTAKKLFAGKTIKSNDKSIPVSLPWLLEAFRLIDTKEYKGAANNPKIMNWADDLTLGYTGDKIPWCGLFVAHCISSQLPDDALPNNPLGARQWKQFGKKIDDQFGCVLVFWRGSPSSWKGHVGFYWAEDETCYHVLGGNQSDRVSITRIRKSRLLAARWPESIEALGIKRFASAEGGLISTNEQ